MSHTPTPWRHDNGSIYGFEDGEEVLIATATRDPEDALTEFDVANIPRIVACVNACDGIDDENMPIEGFAVERAERSEIMDILARKSDDVFALRLALHRISLCSQNSASSKEECGRIARKALEVS